MKNQMQNVIGTAYGELIIIDEFEPHLTPNGSKQRIVLVRCNCCGKEYETRLAAVRKLKKCRTCSAKERRIDVTGKKYGMLTVLSMAEDYISPSGNRLSQCNCLCECGKTSIVTLAQLVTGKTRSCGCIIRTAGLLIDNPELMAKYDSERNEAEGIDVNQLAARSTSKVWWKCNDCGNSWLATIASQNDKIKHGCPYCSGRLVIEGKTDLQSQYPELLEEWDHYKNTMKPNEISAHSGLKVWWKCKECGHEWKAVVSNRTGGSGCPKCNLENVNSFCEQAVYFYVKQAFPDTINGDKHIGMELDLFIPSINVAIEYDGEAWHENDRKTEIDNRKNQLCIDNGITLIRLREPRLKPITNCVSIYREDSTTNRSLGKVIIDLLQYLKIDDIDVNVDRDSALILNQYATKKYENSLAMGNPDIAKEWHPIKNGLLTPDKVSLSSRRTVWWQCSEGHEYLMAIGDRTRVSHPTKSGRIIKGQGCPYCGHRKILPGFNDFATMYPEIAATWHPTKNDNVDKHQYFSNSPERFWWLGTCGHEWEQSIRSRIKSVISCPICLKKKKSPAVKCIETGKVFENAKEAEIEYNINVKSIYAVCRGVHQTAGGYHWEYTD